MNRYRWIIFNANCSLHDEQISGSQSLAAQRVAVTRSTVAKEEARKNFVPIPWRVIGGGVLIGMKKDDPSDEKSSDPDHPYSSHMLPSKPAPLKLKMISRQRSNSIPPTPSISQVKVEHVRSRSAFSHSLLIFPRSYSPLNHLVFYSHENRWIDACFFTIFRVLDSMCS